jgi:hypothetical protein
MSDTPAPPANLPPGTPELPPLWQSLIGMVVRKLVSLLAGALLTYGVLTADQQAEFASLVGGVVLVLVSGALSYLKEWVTRQRWLQALFSKPPRT